MQMLAKDIVVTPVATVGEDQHIGRAIENRQLQKDRPAAPN
jgi:hypothetical protein